MAVTADLGSNFSLMGQSLAVSSWLSLVESFDAVFELAPSVFASPFTLEGATGEVAILDDSSGVKDPSQSITTLSIAATRPTGIFAENFQCW